jgi:hypothetical protein
MDLRTISEAIESALSDALAEEDFNVTVDQDGGEATIEADEWTLQLASVEGALTAFLAIDEEPENEASYPAAVRAALGKGVEDALIDADQELGGALSTALIASGDPFSTTFAGVLRAAAAG